MNAKNTASALQTALRSAAILAAFTAFSAALLFGFHTWTHPITEAALRAKKIRVAEEILPPASYDNDLFSDILRPESFPEAPPSASMTLYRGRKAGRLSVLLVETSASDGYGGEIGLLIGLRADGTLCGVRVTAHSETPGLGDYIDPKKDKNRERPWITQFNGLSLENTPEREWKVKKDGGRFDSLAGATLSPRAVVKATRDTLKFIARHREVLAGDQNNSGAHP